MRLLTTSLILSLLILSCGSLAAQESPFSLSHNSTSGPPVGGNEFWVVFQKNFRDYITGDRTETQKPSDKLELSLIISGSADTRGTVEIEGLKFRKEFAVSAGSIVRIEIDTAAQVRSSEIAEKLAVHVVADHPVLVYGINRRFQTTDSYIGYPVQALGTSYRAACYRWLQSDLMAQVAVIGTENGSTVTITPSVVTQKGKAAGEPFKVTLNRGEVYQIIPRYDPKTKSDLTGTLIESDKPVAVFSGHNCAYVPDPTVKGCNLLCEQLPPIRSWGQSFVVGNLGQRSSSVLRVVAAESGTHIFENDSAVATLDAGGYFEDRNVTGGRMITSDHPVMVIQYSKGFDNGDDVGDPMMIVIQPVERYLTYHRIVTALEGSWHHYVNITAPRTAASAITVDGQPVPPASFKAVASGEYAVATVEVKYGVHNIASPAPIGVYTYGFGYDESAYDAYGSGSMFLIDSATK